MCLEIGPQATLNSDTINTDISSYEIDISENDESCSESTPILQYEML